MTIVYHDDWNIQKGQKDAARHRHKVDDAIRKNIGNVIGEESIITRKGKRTVKVPVKGMKDYKFIYGKGGIAGVGQGDKKPGDILDERQTGDGQDQGQGSGPGTDYMETEVDIDYLLQIMFEDLGLPYLDQKDKASTLVSKGWTTNSISKVGPQSRVHKKLTMKEAIKRNSVYAGEIVAGTGCTLEDAYKALNQSKGEIHEAITIIKEGRVDENTDTSIIIDDTDMRYKTIDEDIEICSNAVIIAKMDVSYSMDSQKKYLVRSLLFWMVEFLKSRYEQVQIRFIQHSDTAQEVDEETFFHRGTTGSTYCHTAIDKAIRMIENEYPVDEWNIYSLYCSDGEDFAEDKTVASVEKLLTMVNMFGYIEVKPENNAYTTLLPSFKNKWNFSPTTIDGNKDNFLINEDLHFFISVLKQKEHVRMALKHMLGLNRLEA